MAITPCYHKFEMEVLKKIPLTYNQLRVFELGNQEFGRGTAKEEYLKKGVIEHVSVDINGRDGSLKFNLDNNLPKNLHNKFNLITNYGTTEHINDQYSVFHNINEVCLEGGIIIHALVLPDNWEGHGRYYYSVNFVKQLAELFEYKIIRSEKFNPFYPPKAKRYLTMACLQKTTHKDVSRLQFGKLSIIDTNDTRRTGNYTSLSKQVRFL